MRWWQWLVLVVLLVIAVVIVIGPKILAWMRRLPPWIEPGIFALAAGLLVFGSTDVIAKDFSKDAFYTDRWTLIIGTFLLVVAGRMYYDRKRKRDTLEADHKRAIELLNSQHQAALDEKATRYEAAIEELRQKHRDEWTNFLTIELLHLLIGYGRALRMTDRAKQREEILSAQRATIGAAQRCVGRTAGIGTRACLYRVDRTTGQLVPVEGGHAGRPPACRQSFAAGDPTYDSIVDNIVVGPIEISAEDAARKHLTYRTYIAHPVSVRPADIYGALMVDCPNPGDLDDQVDMAKVAVLSGLLAATFHVLKAP
jgi:hypothetical protein